MAYTIRRTNGTDTISVQDGRIDNYDTPLEFSGSNTPDYGRSIHQNLLRMLENFASEEDPESNQLLGGDPIVGQFWYNSSDDSMLYRTSQNQWNRLADLDTILDDDFIVARATRWSNPLSIFLSNDASGNVTFHGDEDDNFVTLGVTIENVDASKISGVIDSSQLPSTIDGDIDGNASTATKLATPRTIQISGAVSGSTTFDGSQNVNISVSSSPKLTITGDGSGTATFTNLGDSLLALTVANDSHTHDTRYYTKSQADDMYDLYVSLSDDESISGSKTFTQRITAPSFSSSSDERLKHDIEDHQVDYEALRSLRLKRWKWQDGSEDTGIIAQHVERIAGLEKCVYTRDDGTKTVDYGKLAVHMFLANGIPRD